MGEILIDFLPITEHDKTVGFRMHAGGTFFNVALALARLGQAAAFVNKISTDFFGRYLLGTMQQEGIDTRFVVLTTAPSTLAFVAIEDGEPSYAFHDAGAADTLLTVNDLPEVLFAETRILHFGGISLLRGTTPDAVIAAALRLAGHALLSFDPNIRPGLIHDTYAYQMLFRRVLQLADIVKLSAADLAWLTPGQSVEQAAAALLAQGPALVVVTLGSTGTLALRASATQKMLMLPTLQVEVVDTIGAGDAFSGGLLTGLAERGATSRAALAQLSNSDLLEILHFASTVAALTCTRSGADPPRRADVQKMFI